MERKCTNTSLLFICCGFIILLFILVGYCGTKSDIDRLTQGYDDCGNICGRMNKDLHIDGCIYEDMRTRPKLEVNNEFYNQNITIIHQTCVKECKNGYREVFNRCLIYEVNNKSEEVKTETNQDFFNELSEDLIKTWHKVLFSCFIAFIISFIVLLLFRYAIEYVIWIIYGGFVVLLAIAVIVSLIFLQIVFALILSIVTIIAAITLLWFRKKIKLVAQLFKEASKALVDVPTILVEPVLTFISLLLAFIPFIYFVIVIHTAGDPVDTKNEDGSTHVIFKNDGGVTFARILNVIAFIWFTQFILGCQHFVIAGTICKWYFSRDKKKLTSPVYTTFDQLVRFPLGSVCLGSMLITILKFLQMINDYLQKQSENNKPYLQFLFFILSWILSLIEDVLKYLIRNAYIIVAKDGTPLYESGRKAFNLVWDNLKDVVALNMFGDTVLLVARFFVFALSTFIAYELIDGPEVKHVFVPVFFAGIFSFLIAHCFVTVFEMTIDTIFICFCDDLVENDGASRPYFMSPELKEVMKKLKEKTGGEFHFGPRTDLNEKKLPQLVFSTPEDHDVNNPEPQPIYPSLKNAQPHSSSNQN